MTVAELIKALEAMPQDLPVIIDWPSGMYGDSEALEVDGVAICGIDKYRDVVAASDGTPAVQIT